jgi:hypothetical protein
LYPVPGGCRSGPAGGNGICRRKFAQCGVTSGPEPGSSPKREKVVQL